MGIGNKPSSSGSYEALEEGTYPARLAGIMRIGIQPTQNGEKDQCIFTFELPEEKGSDGRPYHQSKFMSVSLHEMSTMRPVIETLAGKKIPDEKLQYNGEKEHDAKVDEFIDKVIRSSIGKPCLLEIQQYEKDGYTKNGAGTITKPTKGMKIPELETNYGYFDLENPDWAVFDDFPEWQRNKCNKGSFSQTLPSDDDDDIPFDNSEIEESDDLDW